MLLDELNILLLLLLLLAKMDQMREMLRNHIQGKARHRVERRHFIQCRQWQFFKAQNESSARPPAAFSSSLVALIQLFSKAHSVIFFVQSRFLE